MHTNTYEKSQIKLNSEITSQVVLVFLTLRNPKTVILTYEHSLCTLQEKALHLLNKVHPVNAAERNYLCLLIEPCVGKHRIA